MENVKMASAKLNTSAVAALRDYLGVTSDELVLIIADENTREIGLALHEAGKGMCHESFYIEMKTREINGQEPPPAVAKMMCEVDAVVCATTRSLTHTEARREASKKGVRVGTMPGITPQILSRCFSASSEEIIATNDKLMEILKHAKKIELTSALGTNATFYAHARKMFSSTGVLKSIGASGNMPSGEVYFAPVEGKSEGILVCDGSVAGIGMLESPITIEIKKGMAISFSGGPQAEVLDRMLSEVGGKAKAVAEFGIGTNPKAKLSGKILEDEKVLGTVHIAFGNNKSMGGTQDVPIHIDCIIKKPSFVIDDQLIMDNGKLLI